MEKTSRRAIGSQVKHQGGVGVRVASRSWLNTTP